MLAELAECRSSVVDRNFSENVDVVINLALIMCSIFAIPVQRPFPVT